MRHFYAFFLLAVLAVMPAMAQSSYLILNDTAEYTVSATQNNKVFNIPAPCERLTLVAKHEASKLTTDAKVMGAMTIEQNVNGKWTTLYEANPGHVTVGERTTTILGKEVKLGEYEESVTYETLSFLLDRHATQIRFKVGTISSNPKQIKNIQISMASYVETRPSTLNFGEMVVWSEPVVKKFAVEHCNVARLSLSSTNPDFALEVNTVANSGIGQYAVDSFAVTFTPNIMGNHTGTIIVSNGTYTDSLHLVAKVTKRTPVFTFSTDVLTEGDTVVAPFASDCSNQYMLASCDGSVLEVSCGQLIARSAGTASVTVMQLGDDSYWNNRVETYNVTVNPAPVVPTEVQALSSAAVIRFDGRTLSAEADGLTSLEIFDMQGQRLESHEGTDYISTRIFLPAGCYLAVSRAGKNVVSEKFIVE